MKTVDGDLSDVESSLGHDHIGQSNQKGDKVADLVFEIVFGAFSDDDSLKVVRVENKHVPVEIVESGGVGDLGISIDHFIFAFF